MSIASSQHVYNAISAVQGELAECGISKSRKNQQQGYAFRGIDEVYNTLAPILSKHGLVILPRMIERTVSERESKSGQPLFFTVVKAEFDFVAGDDGSKHTVTTYGEAMDSADKATNKAMSAAMKYACLMTFTIPTEGDNDADAVTHDVKAKNGKHDAPPKTDGPATEQQINDVKALALATQTEEPKAAAWASGNRTSVYAELTASESVKLIDMLRKKASKV